MNAPSSVTLRTYTSLWRMERRVYRVNDIVLPAPVPLKVAGVALALGVPWIILTVALLGISPASWYGLVIVFGPPVAAGWAISRPLIDGKNALELGTSLTRHLTSSHLICGLKPVKRGTYKVTPYSLAYTPPTARAADTPRTGADQATGH